MFSVRVVVFAHAKDFSVRRSVIERALDKGILVGYIYMFQGMRLDNWGNFFDGLLVSYEDLRAQVRYYHDRGLKVGVYVDVSECSKWLAGQRFRDSILQYEWSEYFSRMSLNPEKSWWRNLIKTLEWCKGMGFDGINLDRADLVTVDEEEYLREFIKEVGNRGLEYVANTLKPWQEYVADNPHCLFIGTDGVPLHQIKEYDELYARLARKSRWGFHYLTPILTNDLEEDRRRYEETIRVMRRPVVGVDDYNLHMFL